MPGDVREERREIAQQEQRPRLERAEQRRAEQQAPVQPQGPELQHADSVDPGQPRRKPPAQRAGGKASENVWMVVSSSNRAANPVAVRKGAASTTIGYLMCASAPRDRFGRPARPRSMESSGSGSGSVRRPASF